MSIDGIKRIACPKCGWIHYGNPLPSTAAFLLTEKQEILLIKRGVRPGRGTWALPSGFVERDEAPEKTVLRELHEETGLNGSIRGLLGVYTEWTDMYGNILLVAYDIARAIGRLRAGSDSSAVRFFPADHLPRIHFASHRAIIRDGIEAHNAGDVRITVLKSKITEAIITHTRLHYKGSMGIDASVMKAADILPGEMVHVLNYDNGNRFKTYAIEEKAGSRRMVLYGPASLKGEIGQKLCILSYANMARDAAPSFKAHIVTLDTKNRMKRR